MNHPTIAGEPSLLPIGEAGLACSFPRVTSAASEGASQEVSLPVEDHADLPAELAGCLLIEDAAAHA